jgi:hypothetical protein
MTHDELLDAIYWYWRNDARGDGLQPMLDYRKMILAVVQLHRPMPSSNDCYGCRQADPCLNQVYPCETIQIIRKELNSGIC